MSGRHLRLAALVGWLAPLSLAAQGPVVVEWGLHATGTAAGSFDSLKLGWFAGPRLALRSLGGTRGSLSFGAGFRGDSASARGEAAIEYLVSPRAAGRASFYFGGGLAGVVGAGRGGYLLLYVGLESSPGRPRGWAIEGGLGGGFRLRAVYSWRRFPQGWRAGS